MGEVIGVFMWLELLILSPIWLKLLLVALCFLVLHLLPDPSFRSLNYINKVYEPAAGMLTLLIWFFMSLVGLDVASYFIAAHSSLAN